MFASELQEGELFLIQDHPMGPKIALVCEKQEERGVRVHLEGVEQAKALLDPNTEVLRIFEGEIVSETEL